MLTTEQVKELSKILQEDYGLTLSDQKVSEVGTSLVNVFEILLNVKGDKDEAGKKNITA